VSTPSIAELLAQKAAIEKQIADAQRGARVDAINQVRALMSQYGLSLADLGTRSAAAPRASGTKKVAAKYRNAATGESWSGRGLKPKWLNAALASGRSLADFAL
jgi:DNA-binding protein H-NS